MKESFYQWVKTLAVFYILFSLLDFPFAMEEIK